MNYGKDNQPSSSKELDDFFESFVKKIGEKVNDVHTAIVIKIITASILDKENIEDHYKRLTPKEEKLVREEMRYVNVAIPIVKDAVAGKIDMEEVFRRCLREADLI